jgi:hypothetical protein
MALVTDPKGQTRIVKNLGWLIRHATELNFIYINPLLEEATGCRMTAVLAGGYNFQIDWASKRVCWDWLKRRRCMDKTVLYWMGKGPMRLYNMPDTMC